MGDESVFIHSLHDTFVTDYFLNKISKEEVEEMVNTYKNQTPSDGCLAAKGEGVAQHFSTLDCRGLPCEECIFEIDNFGKIYEEIVDDDKHEGR